MAKVLLMVPHFWDPVCVPLGISCLKAVAESRGHEAFMVDFNTDPNIFGFQRAYFEEGKRQIRKWGDWNIERNGTEALAMHQVLYLTARSSPRYRDMVAEVLNLAACNHDAFRSQLNIDRLDHILDELYAAVAAKLDDLLARIEFDVVGCSLFNSTWPGSLFLLRRAKEICNGIRTVVGGPGPLMGVTANLDDLQAFINKHEFIDYYVLGAGERALVTILENPDLPRGIVPATGGALQPIGGHPSSELAFVPDYGNLRVERYLQLSLATSRGCPFECSFCAETVFWGGFTRFSLTDVIHSLDVLSHRHNRRSFYLCDSLSNHIIHPLADKLASMGRSYRLDCYLRPDRTCCNSARVHRWGEGGLVRARLGMESGSQRILDLMNKQNSLEHMETSVRTLASEHILTSTLWIVGYPGETDQEFGETLRFLGDNRSCIYQADAWVFQYRPSGLARSGELSATWGYQNRFSSDVDQVLGVRSYTLGTGITAEERFDRLRRFVVAARELNIPNPYSIFEWIAAEERWRSIGHSVEWSFRDNYLALNE